MLTREEAKQTKCPYFYAALMQDVNAILNINDPFILCQAENCPKWKDVRIGDNKCKENKCNMYSNHSIEKYIEHCLDCKHHFGICNG